MPLYALYCRRCSHRFEEYAPIAEGPPSSCPSCGAAEGEGFSQDWGASNVLGLAYGEANIKTVGQQAEYNAKKAGREKVAEIIAAEKAERRGPSKWEGLPGVKSVGRKDAKRPWWRDGSVPGLPKKDRPVDLAKVPDVERYVREGH